MEFDKKEEEVIQKAIKFWQESELISSETATTLGKSYRIKNSGFDAIGMYALIAAISCGILAFASLVIDEKWIENLRKMWGFSEWIVGLLFTIVSIALIVYTKKRNLKLPEDQASNQSLNISIAMTVGIAITYWTRSFIVFDENYSLPLLFATIAYVVVAITLRAQILWLIAILAACGWWAAQTYFWADGSYRFAGMNYPLRMTLFGLVIWASSLFIPKIDAIKNFGDITYKVGLVLFLFAAWNLSIFGNYDDLEKWSVTKQNYFWYWALGYSILLVGLIYYALKENLDVLRDISLLFFLINIYTRYFEYFWDRTNKGIFFAILAVSFWFVSKKATKWRTNLKSDTNNESIT